MAEEAPYNLLVLGGEDVVETDLVEQFLKMSAGEYSRTGVATADGLPYATHIHEIPLRNVGLGGETDTLIYDVEGIVLVYSVTSRSSFEEIRSIYNVIQKIRTRSTSLASDPAVLSTAPPAPARIILIGNKSDVGERKRAISMQEGNKLAQDLKCDFFETSVKPQTNVEESLQCLIRQCRQRRREHGSGSNSQIESGPSSAQWKWMSQYLASCTGLTRK